MNVFDKYFGRWIQVVDDQNNITIGNYGYDTGIIEGTTGNHCVKCTAVNYCCFKDEQGKKPDKFNATGIKLVDLILNGLTPGLYHPKCHCVEMPIETPSVEDIKLIIPEGKINYLFVKKGDWVRAMGYYEDDFKSFVDILLEKTKEAYVCGDYYIENISKYGCKINLKIDIPGKNEKYGKVYKIESNYMIYSNAKLKMNTPIGGWQ